jgi:hypothetical protein
MLGDLHGAAGRRLGNTKLTGGGSYPVVLWLAPPARCVLGTHLLIPPDLLRPQFDPTPHHDAFLQSGQLGASLACAKFGDASFVTIQPFKCRFDASNLAGAQTIAPIDEQRYGAKGAKPSHATG